MATKIWLSKSGGVIIAEIIKTPTKANFRYFFNPPGFTIPIFVRKNITIGSSKIRPQAITEDRTSPI